MGDGVAYGFCHRKFTRLQVSRCRALPKLRPESSEVRHSLRLVALALALLLGAACIGDRSAAVVVTNDTAQQVTVYPYGRAYPGVRWMLEPVADHQANLLAG